MMQWTLGAGSIFATTNSNVTFGSTLDSFNATARALTVNAAQAISTCLVRRSK